MAAINPTDNTSLIVDEFIQHATTHLLSVNGIVNTLSLYPPIPTPSPGIVNWTGYTIPPAARVTNELRDRIILNEILAKPDDTNIQLETDPVVNKQFNDNKSNSSGFRVDPEAGGYGEVVTDLTEAKLLAPAAVPLSLIYSNLVNLPSATTIPTATNFIVNDEEEDDISGTGQDVLPTFPVFPPPDPVPSGLDVDPNSPAFGATVSFGRLSVREGGGLISIGEDKAIGLTREQYLRTLNFEDGLQIANVDMSAEWSVIARQYLVKKEGFSPGPAKNDEGKLRLGYGTDRILDIGATFPREVKAGDTTTKEQAGKVLELQVRTTYKDKVVGTSDIQITEADWNVLNNPQKAALISFVYNCGSFTYYPHIPAAIKAKDYVKAANGLLNGPIGGAQSGNIYSGLIRRRAEEAGMFIYGLQ
jgi:GH24 family phage-related lysozyme (muramidase)